MKNRRLFSFSLAVLLIFACEPTKQASEEVNEIEDRDAVLAEKRSKLIASYSDTLATDSLIGGYYRVRLEHFSLNDSGLIIPDEYVFEKEGESFTTHNYASRLFIKIDNTVIFSFLINKNDFKNDLEGKDELARYGMLSGPYLYFYPEENELRIDHSLSIPVTDIGIRVEKRFDLSKIEFGEEVYEMEPAFRAFLKTFSSSHVLQGELTRFPLPVISVGNDGESRKSIINNQSQSNRSYYDFRQDSMAQYAQTEAFTTHTAFRADTAIYLRKGIDNGIFQAFYFAENDPGYTLVKVVDWSN
ncbi:MAG: hypothetical protein R3B47_09845 [Bacteroidia bacterium]